MRKIDRKNITTQRVFKEQFQKFVNKPLKEGMRDSRLIKEASNDKVAKCIEAINQLKSIDLDLFYPALALYDMCGIEEPTEEQVNHAIELVGNVDTIYDEDMREDIRHDLGYYDDEYDFDDDYEGEDTKIFIDDEDTDESLEEAKTGRMKFKENPFVHKIKEEKCDGCEDFAYRE